MGGVSRKERKRERDVQIISMPTHTHTGVTSTRQLYFTNKCGRRYPHTAQASCPLSEHSLQALSSQTGTVPDREQWHQQHSFDQQTVAGKSRHHAMGQRKRQHRGNSHTAYLMNWALWQCANALYTIKQRRLQNIFSYRVSKSAARAAREHTSVWLKWAQISSSIWVWVWGDGWVEGG